MTNPMTILSFAAVVAALGLTGGSVLEAATLTLGVLLGSALWWVVLTAIVGTLRTRVTPGALVWVNRASGALILAFGLVAIVAAVTS
jgi:threonine/homoserine/homoserine lactone efflux protein